MNKNLSLNFGNLIRVVQKYIPQLLLLDSKKNTLEWSTCGRTGFPKAKACTFLYCLLLEDDQISKKHRVTDQDAADLVSHLRTEVDPWVHELASVPNSELILNNLEHRCLCKMDEGQQTYLWTQLQNMLKNTDFGQDDSYHLKDFLFADFSKMYLSLLFCHSLTYCLSAPNTDLHMTLNFGNLAQIIKQNSTYIQVDPSLDTQGWVSPTQVNVCTFLFALPLSDQDVASAPPVSNRDASWLFSHRRSDIPLNVRIAAGNSDARPIILHNLEHRYFCNMSYEQKQVLWSQIQSMLQQSNFGKNNPFGLKSCMEMHFNEENLSILVFKCFLYCVFFPNLEFSPQDASGIFNSASFTPSPDELEDYDPYSLVAYRSNSTALPFYLKTGEQTKIFYSLERVLEHIKTNNLMIYKLECQDKSLLLDCRPLPDGLTLFRLEEQDIEQARQAVEDHKNEFRNKVSWKGKELFEMLDNGLKSGVWTAYGYRTPSGELAAYLDYKIRTDSDLELGIQLTDPAYRKKHIASSLVYLFMLMFADSRVVTGTYEENRGMRKVLTDCGFKPHVFYDPVNNLSTSCIRERINPRYPDDPLARSNSVYYESSSLTSKIWQKGMKNIISE